MGTPLSDYLTGKRKPSQALRFIQFLPPGCAFLSQIAANPDAPSGEEPPEWRKFYGWGTTTHVVADLWDLMAKVNTAKNKKAAEYPTPGKKKQKRPVRKRGNRAHDGRGVMVDG